MDFPMIPTPINPIFFIVFLLFLLLYVFKNAFKVLSMPLNCILWGSIQILPISFRIRHMFYNVNYMFLYYAPPFAKQTTV